jgi:quercetin dioxygenase-like cupin family protein
MRTVLLAEIGDEGVSHDPAIRKRVMIRSGVVPHLTNFSQARFAAGQQVAPHSHADMFEIFFVEEGRGTIVVDGETTRLEPGRCVVVEPGEVHALGNDGPGDLVLTYFGIAAGPR